MNDFQKLLIEKGFIAVDEGNYYNLFISKTGKRVLIHVSKETSNCYRINTHWNLNDSFQMTSMCLAEEHMANVCGLSDLLR